MPILTQVVRGIRARMDMPAAWLSIGAVLGAVGPALAQDAARPESGGRIGTVEEIYNGKLLPDDAVATFRNIDRLFPTRRIEAGGVVRELPRAERQLGEVSFGVGEKTYDLYDVMALDSFTALLVLKDGKIAFETYQRGNTPDTRWMSMSVAKSVTSTLAGIAIREGRIAGLDSGTLYAGPVDAALHALTGDQAYAKSAAELTERLRTPGSPVA